MAFVYILSALSPVLSSAYHCFTFSIVLCLLSGSFFLANQFADCFVNVLSCIFSFLLRINPYLLACYFLLVPTQLYFHEVKEPVLYYDFVPLHIVIDKFEYTPYIIVESLLQFGIAFLSQSNGVVAMGKRLMFSRGVAS